MYLEEQLKELNTQVAILLREMKEMKLTINELADVQAKPERWMNTAQAGEYLGRGRRWIMARLQSPSNPDGIPYNNDGDYNFLLSDLDNYMKKNYSKNIIKTKK